MTDESLDRLILGVLVDRAEDVASVARPADEVSGRIALRLRPAYRRPLTLPRLRPVLLLLAIVGLLLVGIVAALIVGSARPVPADGIFECPALASESEIYLVTVHDESGFVSGCRQVPFEEELAIHDSFDPLPGAMDMNSVVVSRASADGTRLLVTWVTLVCDEDARVSLTGDDPTGLRLEIDQERVGGCGPGTGTHSFELTFDRPVSPSGVSSLLRRIQGG